MFAQSKNQILTLPFEIPNKYHKEIFLYCAVNENQSAVVYILLTEVFHVFLKPSQQMLR
jgi:hypothetical protein